MTESDDLDVRVRDALARSASDVAVGPPPLVDLHEAARVRRRRGRLRVAAASLVTAVVVGGGAVAVAVLPDRATDAVDVDDGAAEGMQLVGVGRLGVWVPEEWGEVFTNCGVPGETGIVRSVDSNACLRTRPPDIVTVTLLDDSSSLSARGGAPSETEGGLTRTAVTCDEGRGLDGEPLVECAGSVTDGVTGSVLAESSESDPEVARATVQGLLDGADLLPDGDAVVPSLSAAYDPLEGRPTAELFQAAVLERGLVPEVLVQVVPGRRAGAVDEIRPEPGTLLEAGATVTAVVTTQPTERSDIYDVSGSVYAGQEFRGTLTDTELRARDTVVPFEEGARLSLSAQSDFRGPMGSSGNGLEDLLVLTSSDPTVAATDVRSVFGDVVAGAPGTAEITVEIVIDGVVVPIGSFTVDVS